MSVCLAPSVKIECPGEVTIKHPSGVVSIKVKNESSNHVTVEVKTDSPYIANPKSATIRVAPNSYGTAVFTANYSTSSYDVKFEAYVGGTKVGECTVRVVTRCPDGTQCVPISSCQGDIVVTGCDGRGNYVCCRPRPGGGGGGGGPPPPGPCPSGSECVYYCYDGEIVRFGCDGSTGKVCCKPRPPPQPLQCGPGEVETSIVSCVTVYKGRCVKTSGDKCCCQKPEEPPTLQCDSGQIRTTVSECLNVYKGTCAKSVGDQCCCVKPSPSPTQTPTPGPWCPFPNIDTTVDDCAAMEGVCIKRDGNRCCCAIPEHRML